MAEAQASFREVRAILSTGVFSWRSELTHYYQY